MIRFSFALAAVGVGDKSGKSGLVPRHYFGDHHVEGMSGATNSVMANERLHQGHTTPAHCEMVVLTNETTQAQFIDSGSLHQPYAELHMIT